jgi:hypothetical protein
MLRTVEIYAHDLTAEALEALLEAFETSIEEENWEIFPIAIIERELDSPKGTKWNIKTN